MQKVITWVSNEVVLKSDSPLRQGLQNTQELTVKAQFTTGEDLRVWKERFCVQQEDN